MFYQLVGIANASFYDSLIRSSNQSSLEPTYDKTQVDIRLFNILYCTSKRKTPAPHPPTPPRRLVCVQAKKYINLCSLLIYTPSSVRHRPRRNRSVFSCKMRLAFILIVNLFAADDPPPPTPGFFNENARCTNPPDSLCFLR